MRELKFLGVIFSKKVRVCKGRLFSDDFGIRNGYRFRDPSFNK